MAEVAHPEELSIFQKPGRKKGVERIQYVDYRPLADLSDTSVIDFFVRGSSSKYISLKDSKLCVKLQLTKGDGTAIGNDSKVALVDNVLHSLFQESLLELNSNPGG